MDPIEERMKSPVTELEPDRLLSYFEWAKSEVLGIKVTPGGTNDLAIFKSFQERYGREDAGKIVQYAIFKKGAKAPDGSVLTASSFVANNKWITDSLHAEMQLEEKKLHHDSERDKELRVGFASLKDL